MTAFVSVLCLNLDPGIQTQTHRPLSVVLSTKSAAREGVAEANEREGEGLPHVRTSEKYSDLSNDSNLKKKMLTLFPQLSWLSVDFNNWKDWEDDSDEEMGNFDQFSDVSALIKSYFIFEKYLIKKHFSRNEANTKL